MSSDWGPLVGELTAFATVVALSPFTVIPGLVLVVHSLRPKATGLGFILGWLAGKAAITAVFVQVPGALDGLDWTPPHWTAWARMGAGLLLIGAGVWSWRKPQKPVETPTWLSKIKRITPAGAVAVGVVLTLVNPKVLLMCAAAGYAIGAAPISTLGAGVAVAYFTALGGSTAVIPVLAYVVWAHRVERSIERFKDWMQRRQAALTGITLMIIGIALCYSGIHSL